MVKEISPTRHAHVEGRDVFVFDGLIEDGDLAAYAEALERAAFTRTEFAKPETVDYKHWASEMPLANLVRLPLWPATESALGHARPGETYQPYRAYTNYAAYGDMLYTHVDCGPEQRGITALWFLSTRWEPEWGGETMFFDKSGDAMFCASPRPGRLVLFDGAIPHVGRPPSRICFAPRYSFAVKFSPVQAS